MSLQLKSLTTQRVQSIAVLVMVAVVFVLGCSKKQDNPTAEAPQKTFATPAEASQALHAAVQARDDKALTQVLGPKAQKLVSSGDPAEDKSAADSFAKKYDQMNRLVAMTDGSQVLYIGADNYPFPVPLAQDGSSRWYFDAVAAEQELRARRIGGNELSAMDACRLIASAEELYHQSTHQYTDTIVSTPGKQDGLYWETSEGQHAQPDGDDSTSLQKASSTLPPQQGGGISWILLPIVTTQRGIYDLCQPRQLSTFRHHDLQPGS